MNSQAQLSAAQHLASGAGQGLSNLQNSGIGGGDDDDDDIPELEAVEEDGNVDETGVDPKDIELVIQQVGCSRAKAVRVLKESGGDLINASAYHNFPFATMTMLMYPYSHGCERVILLCCTVSLPHCFALSYHILKMHLLGLSMITTNIPRDTQSKPPSTSLIVIAPNDAIPHNSSTSPSRLARSVRRIPFHLHRSPQFRPQKHLPEPTPAHSLRRQPARSVRPSRTCGNTY